MEYVLRGLGVIALTAGVVIALVALMQLWRAGVPVQTMILAPGVSSGIGIAITGILFLAFGTVVSLLRSIRNNTDQ
jgi:hypothetical protein